VTADRAWPDTGLSLLASSTSSARRYGTLARTQAAIRAGSSELKCAAVRNTELTARRTCQSWTARTKQTSMVITQTDRPNTADQHALELTEPSLCADDDSAARSWEQATPDRRRNTAVPPLLCLLLVVLPSSCPCKSDVLAVVGSDRCHARLHQRPCSLCDPTQHCVSTSDHGWWRRRDETAWGLLDSWSGWLVPPRIFV